MQLKLFKTLWGHDGDFEHAISQCKAAEFNGIEGPAPETVATRQQWKQLLEIEGLDYIAEITTAGTYVPDRNATPQQHLDSLKQKLEQSLELDPLFISCLAGCDAWPENESIEFFQSAMELAPQYDATISFETHRSRSFFNPWTTRRIVAALPDLKLTADYSHWCVVCERLMDSEQDTLDFLADHIHHIHARVGYDQGPQVPHPAAPEYEYALRAHQKWWQTIWQSQQQRGFRYSTMTPEFGPDGYQHHLPFSDRPVGNLWEMNSWMGQEEKQHFDRVMMD